MFKIRRKNYMVFNETFNVKINEEVFRIKIMEDSHGPMRIATNNNKKYNRVQMNVALNRALVTRKWRNLEHQGQKISGKV